jgi:hypothetical protein
MTNPEVRMTIETRSPNGRTAAGPVSVLGHSSLIRHPGFGIRTWRHRGLWLAACGLWLLLAACEVSPSGQFTPQLVVHGFVVAKGIGVRANINRTYAIDDTFDTIFPGVSGVVWRGTDTWPLVHDIRDNYNTRQILPSPAYGDTFGIRVAKDGFDTVYGHTVVPDSFRILFPREGNTVTMSDSMVWTRSRDCAGYYMSFRSVDRGDTFYYSLAIPNDTTGNNFDSLVFTFPQMVFLYQFEPGKHTLRVYALDTNYFDWVSAGGFGLGSGTGETTQLSGGLGVFGSLVGESVEVYVKTDTTFRQESKSEFRSQSAEFRMQARDGGGEGKRYPVWQGPLRPIHVQENPKLEGRMTIETRSTSAQTEAGPGSSLGHSGLTRHSSFGIRVWPRPSFAPARTRRLSPRPASRR